MRGMSERIWKEKNLKNKVVLDKWDVFGEFFHI